MNTLTDWLTTVRTRHATIHIQPDGTPTTRPFTPPDRDHLARHAHALRTAAAGTHPAWWSTVTGKTDPTELHIDDIPTAPYPPSADGLAFACTRCGHPAATLDATLLAWCETCQ